jgi:hypothetical protein
VQVPRDEDARFRGDADAGLALVGPFPKDVLHKNVVTEKGFAGGVRFERAERDVIRRIDDELRILQDP